MITDLKDEKGPSFTQRVREDWKNADQGVKAALGVLGFAVFVVFLLWIGLFFISVEAWAITTAITAATVLILAVIVAIAYLTDEL